MNIPIVQNTPLLELDLLKTLVAISETGNFSGAADVVHRTPSAVSMQVKRIEEILGRPVFKRDSRSVELTNDGVFLVEHARRVLALNREALSRFIAPEVSGEVRLGMSDDISERYLTNILRGYDMNHPGIRLDILVDNSDKLIKSVKSGELDIIIVNDQHDDLGKVDGEVLDSDQLVWAGLKGGIAGEKNPLPICVWEEGCFWRYQALKSIEAIGRDYRVAFQSSHLTGQRAAILSDLVIAPMPRSALAGSVVEVGEQYGLPPMEVSDVVLHLANKKTEAMTVVVEHIRSSFAYNSN